MLEEMCSFGKKKTKIIFYIKYNNSCFGTSFYCFQYCISEFENVTATTKAEIYHVSIECIN